MNKRASESDDAKKDRVLKMKQIKMIKKGHVKRNRKFETSILDIKVENVMLNHDSRDQLESDEGLAEEQELCNQTQCLEDDELKQYRFVKSNKSQNVGVSRLWNNTKPCFNCSGSKIETNCRKRNKRRYQRFKHIETVKQKEIRLKKAKAYKAKQHCVRKGNIVNDEFIEQNEVSGSDENLQVPPNCHSILAEYVESADEVAKLVNGFILFVAKGPQYICSSCHKLEYKKMVKVVSICKLKNKKC